MSKSAEIADGVALERLPDDVADLGSLLEDLGFEGATAHRIEGDTILCSSPDRGAFSVYCEFQEQAGQVRIVTFIGWPDVI
jgi:hypothetical protein